jgi:hypothetical protein
METEENPGIEMMPNSQGLAVSFGNSAEIIKQNQIIVNENKEKRRQQEQEDDDEQIRRDEEIARKAGLVFFNVGTKKDKSKRALIGIENLVGDRTQIHTKIDTATTLSSAAAAASGLVTVLAASGVGMPVSALLAGALLVANKMLDLYKNNLLLRLLMQDAIFIIMDCYLLFSLIEKSYEIIGTYNDPTNECLNEESSTKKAMTEADFKKIYEQKDKTDKENTAEERLNIAKIQQSTSSIRKYQINGIMQAQLKYQIEKLIKTLLSIMETKTLKIIEQDPALHNNAFGKLLLAEKDKREKESYFTYSKFDRNYNRKFGSSIYITEINNALTIINSYLVLLKSNLDTLLKKFEILSPNDYHNIWRAILCSKEYNEYIKPNTQDVINMAKTDVRTVDPDKLIKAIDFVDTVGQNAEAEASRGGSGRSYLRPRIKRKTERRLVKKSKGRGTKSRRQKKSKRRT